MADEPKLIVALEARLDRFEKQLKEAGQIAEREIKNVETKTSQIAIGGTAAIVAAKAIDAAMKEVVDQINKAVTQMLSLGDATKKTGLDLETIQRMGSAARTSGLSDQQFFTGLDAAAAKMDEMNRRTTKLSELLDANNLKYRDQEGNVVNVNKGLELAATLMSRAGSEFEKIEIAKMFGLTEQWVAILGDGVTKFREMQAAANNVNPNLQAMVAHMRAIQEMSNNLKELFGTWGNSIVLSVLPALDTVFGIISQISTALAKLAAGGVMEGMATTLANEMGRVHGIIQAALVKANQLAIVVNKPPGTSGVNWPQQMQEGHDWLLRFDDQFSKHILLLEAEAQAVGKTVGEREKLRALAQLEEAARRQGLTLEQALTEERQKQIEKGAQAAQQAAVLKAEFDQLTSTSRELGSALSTAFADMALEGKKFNEVMKDLSKTIARMAINRALGMFFNAPAGGGLPPLLQLFGRQAGGPVSAGTPYVVGEKGPEVFMPRSSGMIVPNSATRSSSSSSSGATFAPVTNIDARGSQMSEAQFRTIIAENNRQLLRVVDQSAPARQRRFAMLGT